MKIRDIKTKKWVDYYLGGILLFFLKPLVVLWGSVSPRDHSPKVKGELVFIKFLGGGSLVLAFPSLLGIRKKYPEIHMVLITTKNTAPFAHLLGIFNEIRAIDDSSIISLVGTGMRALFSCFKADTLVDLEVYSRLSAVFSVLTMARNRIGFYMENIFWRKNLYTHLVYFNQYSGVYYFYEQVAYLLGGEPAPVEESRDEVLKKISKTKNRASNSRRIVIGHACSEFGQERMLTPAQWRLFFTSRLETVAPTEIILLGSQADRGMAEAIIALSSDSGSHLQFQNLCGKLNLEGAVAAINEADEFWGIDSSLLHFARLLGKKSVSFWGPTSPQTRLKPIPGLIEEVFYQPIHCSPCIHVTELPPCAGDNRCIKKIFDDKCPTDGADALFTAWMGANIKSFRDKENLQ